MSKPINNIAPHLNQYMGSIFEKICTEYLWERLLQNDLSFSFLDLASWWGKNPQTKKQEEIDIMKLYKEFENTVIEGLKKK